MTDKTPTKCPKCFSSSMATCVCEVIAITKALNILTKTSTTGTEASRDQYNWQTQVQNNRQHPAENREESAICSDSYQNSNQRDEKSAVGNMVEITIDNGVKLFRDAEAERVNPTITKDDLDQFEKDLAQMKRLQADRDKWEDEYKNLCKFATDYEEQVTELKAQLEKMAEQRDEAFAEVHKQALGYANLNVTCANLSKHIAKLQRDNQDFRVSYDELVTKYEKLQQQNARLRKAIGFAMLNKYCLPTTVSEEFEKALEAAK